MCKPLSAARSIHVACGGQHTLAITEHDDVFGFGSDRHGQLGLGQGGVVFPVPSRFGAGDTDDHHSFVERCDVSSSLAPFSMPETDHGTQRVLISCGVVGAGSFDLAAVECSTASGALGTP